VYFPGARHFTYIKDNNYPTSRNVLGKWDILNRYTINQTDGEREN
jgi:hypothetical protein